MNLGDTPSSPGPDASGHLPSKSGVQSRPVGSPGVAWGVPQSFFSFPPLKPKRGTQGVFAGLCPVSLWANHYFWAFTEACIAV